MQLFANNMKLLLLLAALLTQHLSSSLDEDLRLQKYAERNYTWPPKMVPDTPGWRKLMMRRFRQLEFVEDLDERYNGYIVTVASKLFLNKIVHISIVSSV